MAVLANLTNRDMKAYYAMEYEAQLELQPWTGFVREVDTDQPDGEKFGGEEPGTGMRERTVPQRYRTTVPKAFTLPNRRYSIERILSQEDVEANKVAKAQKKLDEMAAYAAEHPGEMVEDLIHAADATTDPLNSTVYFFSTSHPRQGSLAVQSNRYVGTTTTGYTVVDALNVTDTADPTDDEWLAALFAVATLMIQRTDSAGRRIMRTQRAFTVATGPELWQKLIKTLAKSLIASGETNAVNKAGFTFNPMLLPDGDTAAEWFLFADNKTFMIHQFYKKPGTLKTFGPGTERYDEHEEELMKTSGVYNVGLENYQFGSQCLFK